MRNLVQVNCSNFGVAASYLLVLGTAAVASDCILGGTEVISAVLRGGGVSCKCFLHGRTNLDISPKTKGLADWIYVSEDSNRFLLQWCSFTYYMRNQLLTPSKGMMYTELDLMLSGRWRY